MGNERIEEVFTALAQESRINIFKLLVKYGAKGLCAGDISERLSMPKNTLSFHLQSLARAGILDKRKEGKHLFYSVDFDAVQGIIEFLLIDCCSMDCDSSCRHEQMLKDLHKKHVKKKKAK